MLNVGQCGMVCGVIIIDRFYIALFPALEHSALAYDSTRVNSFFFIARFN